MERKKVTGFRTLSPPEATDSGAWAQVSGLQGCFPPLVLSGKRTILYIFPKKERLCHSDLSQLSTVPRRLGEFVLVTGQGHSSHANLRISG